MHLFVYLVSVILVPHLRSKSDTVPIRMQNARKAVYHVIMSGCRMSVVGFDKPLCEARNHLTKSLTTDSCLFQQMTWMIRPIPVWAARQVLSSSPLHRLTPTARNTEGKRAQASPSQTAFQQAMKVLNVHLAYRSHSSGLKLRGIRTFFNEFLKWKTSCALSERADETKYASDQICTFYKPAINCTTLSAVNLASTLFRGSVYYKAIFGIGLSLEDGNSVSNLLLVMLTPEKWYPWKNPLFQIKG